MINFHAVYCKLQAATVAGAVAYHHTTLLQMAAVQYQHNHRKPMSCQAVSQLLSTRLYYKRFFPYYAFNLCAGLDSEGKGAVYSYDAVGSFERSGFACQGSGVALVHPTAVLPLARPAHRPTLVPRVRPVNGSSSFRHALDSMQGMR